MGDEPFKTQRETSTKSSSGTRKHSTIPHLAAYAAERARLLSGCYRRGDANDPEIYISALTAVLSIYDADLIREVTDPRTGIQTTEKFATFMPNVGELKIYCEAKAAHRERLKRLGDLPRPDFTRPRLEAPEAPAGSFAHVFVPENHDRYAKLVAWSETAPNKYWRFGKSSDGRSGIWVAYGVWDPDPTFMSGIGTLASKLADTLKPDEFPE